MSKQELIEKNPLRILSSKAQATGACQRMGLVMARAGVGKTAILVQIALNSILHGSQVVHVSIGQSLDKTKAWYDDIFKDIVTGLQLEKASETREEMMRHRMIMTFNASTFSPPKLEERLNDLLYQNIFQPACLIIDGFDFTRADRQVLHDLRELMNTMNLDIWFSATTHRDDDRVSAEGVPAPCHEVGDLFDTVILIQPVAEKESALLNIIKDTTGCAEKGKTLNLDTSTLMIKEG